MEWRKKTLENTESVDPKVMIALEEELLALKQQYKIPQRQSWWIKIGDRLAERATRKPVLLNRKKYLKIALSCGWLCGAHRFYSHQKVLGGLYLLFCWTGIPIAMTLVDCMIVLPMKEDEHGNILV